MHPRTDGSVPSSSTRNSPVSATGSLHPPSRRCAGVLILLLLLALLAGCSDRERLPRLDSGKTILAFGDSLTAGNGAGPGQSYPEVLEGLLKIRVVRSGVPGEVSAEGLRRLPAALAETRPDVVILCHGGNDFLRRMDTRETARNLRAMIAIAREKGVAVVLLAVPAPGLLLKPPALYREIAGEMKVPLEDRVLTDVLSDGSLKGDPIHPNAEGYRRVAGAVVQLLRKHGAVS
ncbi:MAG TPA: arylesterase [Syntrophales bacterium]|nr:arylesterase [Syntrophales bacterium]